MEHALGLHFQGHDGEAFFRSSLVQTLFYGLFSGWMLWRQSRRNGDRFDWRGACEYLALPLIGDLYEEIARPRRLADLGLREPLEWATASLNRVVEEEFFQRFDTDHAITLFYEPFLQAFDPDLRKELGVWYTPPEIVQYMVGRVDQLLRSELGIADGLADEQVFVLDPAAGTGSYLVEVARRIHQTLTEQGQGALAAARVKRALRTRIFGFEILPAPYVVAHLQLGVFLRSLGASLASRERFEVFLTNALTGWEPPKEPKSALLFPELDEEAELAAAVKQSQPILVILGNPPYNGFAGVAQEEEADLVAPYKDRLREEWGIRKQMLDDLYVRFFRLAERRIGEVGGRGIICFISNYSWLDGLSHPIMRKRLLSKFNQVWIDNCNGDKYRTGKRTPDGQPDQSMFSSEDHPIGIQPGTAVATLVKSTRSSHEPNQAAVWFRELWGLAADKKAELTRTLGLHEPALAYTAVSTSAEQRYAIYLTSAQTSYSQWFAVPQILPKSFPGVLTRRDEFVVDISRERLIERMKRYYNASVTDAEIATEFSRAMEDGAGFVATVARRNLLVRGFDADKVMAVHYRPFDLRWIYCEGGHGLVSRPSPEFLANARTMGLAIEMRQKLPTLEWDRGLVTNTIADHMGNGTSVYFPERVFVGALSSDPAQPNIDDAILNQLCTTFAIPILAPDRGGDSDEAKAIAEDVFFSVVAVLWSPAYRQENEAALRQDWPRVPIPADRTRLAESARLGRLVADLLLPDKPVRGVTCGSIRPELRSLGVPSKVGGGNIDPDAGLKIEASWGFFGAKKAVMCGKGKTLPATADPQGAVDVYINDCVYWANVPLDVWTMTIGGYPVIKKWLSYREYRVLGRTLRSEELTYITEVVRRLKSLLTMGDALDANYRTAAGNAMAFDRPS